MPASRPTKYKREYDHQAYEASVMGATDFNLARLFNVSESTINLWKKTYSKFSESIKRGKAQMDEQVEAALLKRALGYEHPEDDIRTLAIGDGMSRIEITPTVKHYPPDTAAASLWLRNRQPAKWRDKTDVEHSGGISLPELAVEIVKQRRKQGVSIADDKSKRL